jgi:small subunit ribosomal protein S16
MAVVIRLMRAGAKKRPFYRMVAADSRRQRDGRFLEILGHYNPLSQPYELVVQKDRVEMWIARGARPSDQVASLLRTLGVAMHRTRALAAAATAAAGAVAETDKPAKPKKATKRGVPRKLSARKVEKRARKAAAKKAGTTPAPKKKAAKKT